MKTFTTTLAFALAALGSVTAALNLDWHTVGAGGGTSTSADGRFSVSGTIGQPDAGVASSNNGRFQLSGGFWQAQVAFCDCTLSIGLSGTNLVISWPCELNGCVLEYAEELREPPAATIWHPVSPPAGGHTYTTPLTGAQRYFRLRAP